MGDEPGIFGDAHYSGLSARLPITIFRADLINLQDNPFQLVLETEGVKTFSGYPGHEITSHLTHWKIEGFSKRGLW